jgi:hypothetical protein
MHGAGTSAVLRPRHPRAGEVDMAHGKSNSASPSSSSIPSSIALIAVGPEFVGVLPPANEPDSRDARRSRRKRHVRARTINVKRLSRRELARQGALIPSVEEPRPRTRAECREGPRPCPHVACKHHLYLDVSPRTGAIKLNFPDLEVWEMGESCALDVAENGGITLEDVGSIMNLTRERIRQLEVTALGRGSCATSERSERV